MPSVVKNQNNRVSLISGFEIRWIKLQSSFLRSFFRTSYRNLQHNIAIKYSFSAMAWQIVDISPTLTHLSESKLGGDWGAGIRTLVQCSSSSYCYCLMMPKQHHKAITIKWQRKLQQHMKRRKTSTLSVEAVTSVIGNYPREVHLNSKKNSLKIKQAL